jgi:hypothetical protein
MRQKNTSGSVLVCPEAGRDIGPGEELDHPTLITGCEPVTAKAKTEGDAKPAPASKSKAAAAPGAVEGSAP